MRRRVSFDHGGAHARACCSSARLPTVGANKEGQTLSHARCFERNPHSDPAYSGVRAQRVESIHGRSLLPSTARRSRTGIPAKSFMNCSDTVEQNGCPHLSSEGVYVSAIP